MQETKILLDVQALINQNSRLCTLLGIATSIITFPDEAKATQEWWNKAIEEVVYRNKPIPSLPGEK